MIKIGIIGGTGYTGVELLRILIQHPEAQVKVITSRQHIGEPVSDLFPSLRNQLDLKFSDPEKANWKACDLVFSATPNGIAMQYAQMLLDHGVRLIDLAADFRIKDLDLWEKSYGMSHICPNLVAEAVYGLPELNRSKIRDATLVANPGCYPTAVTLGFLPLLESGLVNISSLIADVKSGVSGAGRGANVSTLFSEASDNFKAYAVDGHRHHPEIVQTLNQFANTHVTLTFVPHLAPMIRGIHATLYAELNTGSGDLTKKYTKRFSNEPFVDVMDAQDHPDTRSVRGSNLCRIAVHQAADSNRVVVLSVIDNMVKGAAGQAVQNMNLMFGVDEALGLESLPLLP